MEYLQQIGRVNFITCLFATVSTIHKERETVEKYDNNLIAEKHGLGANAAGDVSVTNEYIILPILVNLPYYDHVYNITQQRNNYSLFLNNFLVQDLKFLDAKSFAHQLKSTFQTKLSLFSVSTHNNRKSTSTTPPRTAGYHASRAGFDTSFHIICWVKSFQISLETHSNEYSVVGNCVRVILI